jgi:TPR repeat protein
MSSVSSINQAASPTLPNHCNLTPKEAYDAALMSLLQFNNTKDQANFNRGLELLKQAAEAGLNDAAYKYAETVLDNSPEKIPEAINLLEKLFNEKEDRIAGRLLVFVYLEEKGEYYQPNNAIKVLQELCKSHDNWAMFKLGLIYYHGTHSQSKDAVKAKELFERAIRIYTFCNQNTLNRKAVSALFSLYYDKKEFKAAFEIYPLTKQTAEETYRVAAYKFYEGKNVEEVSTTLLKAQNKIKSIKPENMTKEEKELLGRIFQDLGRLALRDEQKFYKERYKIAVKYWEKGKDLDNAGCNYYLGIAHYIGSGYPKNQEQAKVYWKKASDLGHPAAKHEMALLEKTDSKFKLTTKEKVTLKGRQHLDSIDLKDREIEDRLAADRPRKNRVFHWIKRNDWAVAVATLKVVGTTLKISGLILAFPFLFVGWLFCSTFELPEISFLR